MQKYGGKNPKIALKLEKKKITKYANAMRSQPWG